MATTTPLSTSATAASASNEPPPQTATNSSASPSSLQPPSFIRGVNLGGWLVLERYITPYQFAITDCHVAGDFCWYPGQVSAPPASHADYRPCDLYQCKPLRTAVAPDDDDDDNPATVYDYPVDEYTLAQAFGPADDAKAVATAEQWLNYHFEHFMTRHDIQEIRASGLTHVRVPLPHWILGTKEVGAPWIVGHRWKYFVRLVGWCRDVGLQVWPDIHTAPGSQNGFDNSGHALTAITCQGWSNSPAHVEQSLQVIRDITAQIKADGLDDVVTGFGLLNEPFKDCDRAVYENFIEQGLDIVRDTLGPQTAVYVSDMFLAKTFNNGHWWINQSHKKKHNNKDDVTTTDSAASRYNHTYLDSHYYQVFATNPRGLSPRQHIAYVCQSQYKDVLNCCYRDGPNKKTIPAAAAGSAGGVRRLVGEWSAAVDKLPIALLRTVMEGIAATGLAPQLDRQLSPARQAFLQHYMQAQMVSYEAADVPGLSAGWFYWTAKMEGGAFAEWDYLRAVRQGWMPTVPTSPTTSSQDLYGTCYDIIFRTDDDMSVIHEFPDPATIPVNWWEDPIDDDVVVSHGDSLMNVNGHYIEPVRRRHSGRLQQGLWSLVAALLAALAVRRLWWRRTHGNNTRRIVDGDKRHPYEAVGEATTTTPTSMASSSSA